MKLLALGFGNLWGFEQTKMRCCNSTDSDEWIWNYQIGKAVNLNLNYFGQPDWTGTFPKMSAMGLFYAGHSNLQARH